jgi:hypothetical protein
MRVQQARVGIAGAMGTGVTFRCPTSPRADGVARKSAWQIRACHDPTTHPSPLERDPMLSLARSMFLDSEISVEQELPHVGSALENPFVYDAVARELKQMALHGLVEIVQEHRSTHGELLIDSLRYRRMRVG